MVDKVLHRNIKLIYAYSVCLGTMFVLPVLILYYKDKMGLSFQDFLLGEVIFAIVVISFEVPTGWLSDKWSRKWSLISGVCVLIIGYGILLFANSLFEAMLAQGILGIAIALASGTTSALIYDTLLETGDEDQYMRIEGKKHALMMYGTVMASLAGGFLYTVDIHLPLVFDLVTLFMGLVVLLFVVEPKRHREQEQKHPIKDMIETVSFTLKGHVEIAGIVMLATIIFSATKVIVWGQQAYYQYLDLPAEWFGILIASGCLIGALSSHFGHSIGKTKSNKFVLGGLLGLIVISAFVAGFSLNIYTIPLMMVGSLIWGFGNPRVQTAINDRVGSERRAAILSTANMMVSLMFIPLGLVAGYISENYDIGVTFMSLSVWVLLSGLIAMAVWIKREK